jgi:hemerythrin-like metal-binding protein
MTDLLTWRHEWQTGIDWVDRDHHAIADLLNCLAERCARDASLPASAVPRADRAGVLGCLDDLIERARAHFVAEEGFLEDIGYPGLLDHRREHVMQLAEFSELRRGLEHDPTRTLGTEAIQAFKRWFFNHVIAEDRHYAEFYRSLAPRPPPA